MKSSKMHLQAMVTVPFSLLLTAHCATELTVGGYVNICCLSSCTYLLWHLCDNLEDHSSVYAGGGDGDADTIASVRSNTPTRVAVD